MVEQFESNLAEPLPDEVSEMELELIRRKRIAMENEQARSRMAGFVEMERARG